MIPATTYKFGCTSATEWISQRGLSIEEELCEKLDIQSNWR